MPKEGSEFICLSIYLLIDSVFRADKNYPQVIFEEWKYVVKEKNMPEYFTDDIEISFDDSDKGNSI